MRSTTLNEPLEAALPYSAQVQREALRTLVSVNVELEDIDRARRWAREAVRQDTALASEPRIRDLLNGRSAN